eukprot:354041-Chlamydomonas_euryale.AAC.2
MSSWLKRSSALRCADGGARLPLLSPLAPTLPWSHAGERVADACGDAGERVAGSGGGVLVRSGESLPEAQPLVQAAASDAADAAPSVPLARREVDCRLVSPMPTPTPTPSPMQMPSLSHMPVPTALPAPTPTAPPAPPARPCVSDGGGATMRSPSSRHCSTSTCSTSKVSPFGKYGSQHASTVVRPHTRTAGHPL